MAPWKTASSTSHASLGAYNESPYDRLFHWNPVLNRVVHQHLTLTDLLMLPEGKLGYKIGAFVRNPYDRAYSGFRQLQRDANDQPRLNFDPPWIGDLVRAQIAENMARIIAAEFDFDKWIEMLPDYEVFEPGRNTNMVLHPAHYWTHVGGKQRVDFVGKAEAFDTEFRRFCDYVGIDSPPVVLANVSDVAGTSSGGSSKYADRMSRRALDRINDLFSDDFDYFGYEQR